MPVSDHREQKDQKTAVLLLNIGTPKSYQVGDVRRYLREFLMDPLVITIPFVLRWILVNIMIVWFRAGKSARAYKSVWTAEGSPLMVYSLALQNKLRRLLPCHKVYAAMRYQEPSIPHTVSECVKDGVTSIVAVPMFPQYSSAATESALLKLKETIQLKSPTMGLTILDESSEIFRDGFLKVQSRILEKSIASFAPDHILMSFHGLPESHLQTQYPSHCLLNNSCCGTLTSSNSRCYRAQCFDTARQLASRCGISKDLYSVSFQSRLGRAKWIEPYTDFELDRLRTMGRKKLMVVCPSFVADCLETIEEIGLRLREDWLAKGGESFALVSCVNDDDEFAQFMAAAIAKLLGSKH
jgi:protoporphyrin/coproporphyrin ferrochelatase